MRYKNLHPADQLVLMIDRIYRAKLTTTSGGNLSILDDNGDIWITPSGIDKGSLTRADMCCVKPDGTVIGPHIPSIELPFHTAIYQSRPDIHAVLHAHSSALVAFSIVRVLPDVNLLSNTSLVCDSLAFARYAVPGSKLLGEQIAAEFRKGYNAVLLEKHGICIGAPDLFEAFKRFETMEISATIECYANKLGTPRVLSASEVKNIHTSAHTKIAEFSHSDISSEERAVRQDMISFIHRAYRQQLFCSTQGTCSVRLSDGSFLITPCNIDRAYLEETDLVLIKDGRKEKEKIPSHTVGLHALIYQKHPEIRSVLGAYPPHAMAYAVTTATFDSRTIPESYVLLREIRKIPFKKFYENHEAVADSFSARTPVLICENNQVLVTGSSLLQAFDRLEVIEATASSLLFARDVGKTVYISDTEAAEIDAAFNLN